MDARKYLGGGNHLKAADLPAGAMVPVTVRDVTEEELTSQRDGATDIRLVLYFVNKDKGVKLCQSNVLTMIEAHGADTVGWIGTTGHIHTEPTSLGPGVRFRPEARAVPAAPVVPQQAPAPVAPPATIEQAVQYTPPGQTHTAPTEDEIPF